MTAIITPWGVYRFLAFLFGFSTTSGEYQARMAVLKGIYLNGAIKYIDDIVIYGRNVTEFQEVLNRISDTNGKIECEAETWK